MVASGIDELRRADRMGERNANCLLICGHRYTEMELDILHYQAMRRVSLP